ncbi:TIGR02452 family protein [Pseudoflavitalea sp. X16]|uniref:TIGR02452 family protein n=1 Tax=Paraflavitalea devenefica TaxID=2716334 RepID=UPI0014227365|nr:TIGR02452 family protein [Paraflavitalea devenefica]NII24478.1 TIGR02452 family protein [Paraflavitalea devenefica]
MNQRERVAIAEDTLQLIEQGFYINTNGDRVETKPVLQQAIDNTRLFTPEALADIRDDFKNSQSFDTNCEVTNETTLDAVRRLSTAGFSKVLCLNFASAKNPGGGFLGGAIAQEECIARASGLYPCLLTAPGYYSYHRKQSTCLYSDHMIYSPGVPVMKDEAGNLLDALVCPSIITSPAVNAGVVMEREPSNRNQITPVMRVRIEKLLALCAHYGHDTLVLGAWGCGVFRNNPEDIATLFQETLQGPFNRQFRKIVFAVKTNKESIIEPFRQRFIN